MGAPFNEVDALVVSSTTITVQNVVNWARTQTKLIPIVGVGGFSNEPALTIANNVMQEILSPPYNWKFNRREAASFPTVNQTQDYTANITDCGWLEDCMIEDAASTYVPKPIFPIKCVYKLMKEFEPGNPEKICFINETATQLTFRLWPVPSTFIWNVYPAYQKKAPLITALTQTWSPIPDELAYVYRQGFLAMALKHADDKRYPIEYAAFQTMIMKALGLKDAEERDETFQPARAIMIG